jgi:lysyl endopeptidase
MTRDRRAVSAAVCVASLAWAGVVGAQVDRADAQGPAWAGQDLNLMDTLVGPAVDVARLEADDLQREATPGVPNRFATPWDVRITPETAGVWDNKGMEDLVWRLRVQRPGALSINLGFTDFWLPEGATLTVGTADGSEWIRPFTAKDNQAHGQLWTPVVTGDDVVIELVVPEKKMDDVILTLARVSGAFEPWGLAQVQGERDGSERSGSCNVDVVCSAADGFPEVDDWRDEIPSVGAYTVFGIDTCTGALVNNTANDLTPYFLTAFHCGVSSGDAPSVVIYWNFENSTCRPPGSGASGGAGDGPRNQFSSGTILRAGHSPSDMTLLEVSSPLDEAWELTFSGWDRRNQATSSAVAIHHPGVDEKRISFEDDPTSITSYLSNPVPGDGTHIRVTDWDLGTTEPGSSGSPLYSPEHRIVGQLHGGFASCTSQTSDWYGRIAVSWTGGGSSSSRLSDWLDPIGSGAQFVDTITGAGLTVDPGDGETHAGLLGGPFAPASVDYTLANPSPDPVTYEVSIVPGGTAPMLIDGGTATVSGTLAGLTGTAIVGVSVDQSAAAALASGVYTTDIEFLDVTNARSTTRTHVLEVGLTGISVTPAGVVNASGPEGGPFAPAPTYTVTSTQPTPVQVRVSKSEPWLELDGGDAPITFTLSGVGDSRAVQLGYDADTLGPGIRGDAVVFENLVDGTGNTSRQVFLDIGRIAVPATDTPISISDNSTIESTITVGQGVCIADVNVKIDITHTFIGDLEIDLISPSGTTVRLHDRTGGSDNDILGTYDDSGPLFPDGPGTLADFIGEVAVGDWTLRVGDRAGGDTGQLNVWTLFLGAAPACVPVAADLDAATPEDTPVDVQFSCASAGTVSGYTIRSLPGDGLLIDPNGGAIVAVPYTLLAGGDTVTYDPLSSFIGVDSFNYECFDGETSNLGTVSVTVGAPGVIYEFDLDTDPQWDTQGQWAHGKPTGQGGGGVGGPDPSSGHTGDNVYGYNLSGNYTNSMPETYLTTGPLDLTNASDTELVFWRWLGIESAVYDRAVVRVSGDGGATWNDLWSHNGGSFNDDAWVQQTFDISQFADGKPDVRIRWVMGTTDTSVTYPGWNIDDIQIKGVAPGAPAQCEGDVNGDGTTDVFDFTEMSGVFGQSVPPGTPSDLNNDGEVDVFDFATLAADFGCHE